jgi:hypothetical protein
MRKAVVVRTSRTFKRLRPHLLHPAQRGQDPVQRPGCGFGRHDLGQREEDIVLEGIPGQIEDGYAVELRYLGRGIHARGAGFVPHVLAQKMRADEAVVLLYSLIVRRNGAHHGNVQFRRKRKKRVGNPELERQVARRLEIGLFVYFRVYGAHGVGKLLE